MTETYKVCRLEPNDAMRTAGARRLLSFEDGTKDEDFNGLQWAGARNEAERVWRSMWLLAGDGWEVGWVIERGDSQPHSPTYWGGPMDHWSQDHMDAVRFARKQDAERVAMRLGQGYHRVAEHAWDVRPRAPVHEQQRDAK